MYVYWNGVLMERKKPVEQIQDPRIVTKITHTWEKAEQGHKPKNTDTHYYTTNLRFPRLTKWTFDEKKIVFLA